MRIPSRDLEAPPAPTDAQVEHVRHLMHEIAEYARAAREEAGRLLEALATQAPAHVSEYLRKNPPNALVLFELIRQHDARAQQRRATARAARYAPARSYTEDYFLQHEDEIRCDGKRAHAEPLVGVMRSSVDYPDGGVPDYRTVVRWWNQLEASRRKSAGGPSG